jgi:hypothetical protein
LIFLPSQVCQQTKVDVLALSYAARSSKAKPEETGSGEISNSAGAADGFVQEILLTFLIDFLCVFSDKKLIFEAEFPGSFIGFGLISWSTGFQIELF